VNRRRKILLALMIPTLAVAVWQWFLRPYEWRPDPRAACRIEMAGLRRDHSYHWLDLRLRVTDPESFRIDEKLALLTAAGRELAPGGLTLGGAGTERLDPAKPTLATTETVSLKFWLEPGDLDGPLILRVNGARLQVRNGDGVPPLDDGESRIFHTSSW
jgi:hypothetical protein